LGGRRKGNSKSCVKRGRVDVKSDTTQSKEISTKKSLSEDAGRLRNNSKRSSNDIAKGISGEESNSSKQRAFRAKGFGARNFSGEGREMLRPMEIDDETCGVSGSDLSPCGRLAYG